MAKPIVSLVLGGAKNVFEDIKAALEIGEYDRVVAVNNIGMEWKGDLDVWYSLHFDRLIKWRLERLAKGLPDAKLYVTHDERQKDVFPIGVRRKYRFHGQTKSGSSGLAAVKNELIDEGTDKVVLAGMPMSSDGAHYFSANIPWKGATSHIRGWEQVRGRLNDRVKSMSGLTRDMFGAPTREWLLTECRNTEELR